MRAAGKSHGFFAPSERSVTPSVSRPLCLRRRGNLLSVRKDFGTLIGDCGIRFPAGDDSQVEIGFTIAPAHQGHGYATEAVRAVLRYLFTTLRKHRRALCSVVSLGAEGRKVSTWKSEYRMN
ncbi:MAG: GNAT family N-acetyltransferase [Firmicutes bacterium]|nr:GNAT family N-acetyltransferase [Bacillota bacterium]